MSPLNVHVNRKPISGTISFFKYLPGKYLMAFNPKSSQLNEQTYVVAKNDRVEVAYKQIAGFLARRICWYIKENDPVEQGAEYGFIRFGSRIDLLIPTDSKIQVKLGDVVKAGRTVIAEI
ncbi:MAG: phosphatidylserine decarboxylase, partial [Bacteroidota bacterium]